MFDFSFGEIGLIAVVALVVLGPERLPKVARTAGVLVRRARTSWQNVRDEIERELEAEDLKRSIKQTRAAFDELHDSVRDAATRAETGMTTTIENPAPGRAEPTIHAALHPPDGTNHGQS